jgi:hypothetical protein
MVEERMRTLVSFLVDFSAKTYLRTLSGLKMGKSDYVFDPKSFKKFSTFKTVHGNDRFGVPFFVHNFLPAKPPGAPDSPPININLKTAALEEHMHLQTAKDRSEVPLYTKSTLEKSMPAQGTKKIQVVQEEEINSDLVDRFVTSAPLTNQRTFQNTDRALFRPRN